MDTSPVLRSVVTLSRWPLISRRGRALAFLLAFLFSQSLLNPSRVWHYLLLSFGLALGLSYLWTLALARNVRVARHVRSALLQVGDRLVEDFAAANSSLLPAPWLEIRDSSALPGHAVATAFPLAAQSEERWGVSGICGRRGQFGLGPWSVRCGDPFGFFEAVGHASRFAELLVYPPVGVAPEVVLRRGEASGSGRHLQPSLSQTVTSSAVRQYLHGDPPRYIHWPTTARVRELMVKDFDVEPAGDLWVVMDMSLAGRAGDGDDSTEEYIVLAAAALVARSLSRSQAAGLLAYGSERVWVPPAKGEGQYWRLMRALATCRAEGSWSIGRVLDVERWNLGHGSTVAVLASTAAADTAVGVEILRRLGVSANVLLFDAASFGGEGDAATIARQLVDAGVPYWVIGRGYEFVPLSRRERRRRRPVRWAERWELRAGA